MCTAMKEIRAEAREEGREKGREEERNEGQNMLNHLFQKLITVGRMDDLIRSTSDMEFQKQLLQEFKLM